MSERTQKAKQVKRLNEKKWMDEEGVTAVGVGITGKGDVGIIISVKGDIQNMRKKFPSQVEGIPVELQVSGEFRAQ